MAAAAKNDQANIARSTTPRAPPTPVYYVIGTTYVYMHSFVHAQARMHARAYALRMHESVRAEKHTYMHKGGGNMHVRVKCAVGLPKMDISTGACDPYVKVILGGKEHKVSCKAGGEERDS